MRLHEEIALESAWLGLPKPRSFTSVDEPAIVVWPALAFIPTSAGGHGEVSITGSRFDVLDAMAPAWQETAMRSAAASGMPLLARKIGRAHKHSFWRIEAANPEAAQADSVRIKFEKDAAKAAREAESQRYRRMSELQKHGRRLSDDEAVVLSNGDIILASVVIAEPIRSMFGTVQAMMLVDGEPMPWPDGATVQQI